MRNITREDMSEFVVQYPRCRTQSNFTSDTAIRRIAGGSVDDRFRLRSVRRPRRVSRYALIAQRPANQRAYRAGSRRGREVKYGALHSLRFEVQRPSRVAQNPQVLKA